MPQLQRDHLVVVSRVATVATSFARTVSSHMPSAKNVRRRVLRGAASGAMLEYAERRATRVALDERRTQKRSAPRCASGGVEQARRSRRRA
jgi:hypothetical protein